MSNQPRALALAHALDSLCALIGVSDNEAGQAAYLLRLQHEVIGELVVALGGCIEHLESSNPQGRAAYARALVAEARAKELEGEK